MSHDVNSTAIDVNKVAGLARLQLSEEEQAMFQKQLGDVLGYVAQLQQVDVSAVPDTPIDPHLPTNVLRADVERPSFSVEAALQNAPAQANNLITVPQIIE
jgi:aspartyl-tRNA(Asn)/glutamyl-tRNA(Gln) amidotransferase subunit C